MKTNKLLGDLVPAFYSLAIATSVLDSVTKGWGKADGLKRRNEVRRLRKRGLIVLEIIDKRKYITTYQEVKELKNIELFIKLNKGKWKLTKENYFGVKTGRYILTRIYRRYTKPYKEPEVCKECGRSLEDDY